MISINEFINLGMAIKTKHGADALRAILDLEKGTLTELCEYSELSLAVGSPLFRKLEMAGVVQKSKSGRLVTITLTEAPIVGLAKQLAL